MNEEILDEFHNKPEHIIYATFGRRIAAYLLDFIILIPFSVLITLYSYFGSFVIIISLSIKIIYKVYLEKLYGQTFGKRIMKISVKTENYKNISYAMAFKRSYFYILMILVISIFGYEMFLAESLSEIRSIRAVEHWSFFAIGYTLKIFFLIECMLMPSHGKFQTLHDKWAKTVVVKNVF